MVSRLDIAMTPAEAPLLPPSSAYVVIDALRATTTMAFLFSRGLARLRVVMDVDAALRERDRPDLLLLGETAGLRPDGFDFGNSPVEVSTGDFAGREAIQATSNGTKALCAVAGLGPTFAGAFVNLSAVADRVGGFERVCFICAGNAGARTFSLEDFAVAAAFVQELSSRFPAAVCGDSALLALDLQDPARTIRVSEHAADTRSLGFEADIDLACRRDAAPAVPVVVSRGDGWAVLEPA